MQGSDSKHTDESLAASIFGIGLVRICKLSVSVAEEEVRDFRTAKILCDKPQSDNTRTGSTMRC